LRAMCAAPGRKRNIAQAFRAGTGCGRLGGHRLLESVEERINRQDQEEIDGAGDDQERNYSIDQIADRKHGAIGVNDEVVEVRLADGCGDQRGNDAGDELRDDGIEGRSHDYGDSEIDDASAQDEIAKSLNHASSSS